MAGSRPNIFQNDPVDLSRFTPKAEPTHAPVPNETVRRVAAEAGFPSRNPAPTTVDQLSSVQARPVSPKSGRTVLLNARVTQRAHDRFHEIVAAEAARFRAGEIMHKPTLGEIVERALAALERERGEGRG
jgi:hypothetical protein